MDKTIYDQKAVSVAYSGTRAEQAAFTGWLPVGATWDVTDEDVAERWNGGAWVQTHSGGKALVSTAKTGPAHNRNIADAVTTHPGDDTTNTATWTEAEAVTELRVTAVNSSGTGAALQNDEAYLVVVNAPTAAIALAWLTDAGSASADVQYEMGYIGQELIIKRTTAITRIDVLPLNEDMRFVIGAV